MPSGLLIWTASPSENWLHKSEQIRRHESARKTVVTDLCNLISEPASLFFPPVLPAISEGLHKHLNRQQGSLGVVAEAAYYRGFRNTLIQVFLYTKKWRHRKINLYDIYIYHGLSIIIIVKLY